MKVREVEDIQKDLKNAEMELIKQQTKVNGLQLEKNAKRLNDIEKLLPKTKRIKTKIDETFFEEWKYKNVAMWCKKKEYAEEFCKIMNEQGLRWRSERSYLDENFWNIYTIQTSYDFNIRGYFSKDWGISNDYTILDFEDYIVKEEKEKMSKKELAEFLVDNFADEDGCLNLSGLDFSEYDYDIDIGNMKVARDLVQNNQKVQGDLLQNRQMVGGDLVQGERKRKVRDNTHVFY